MRDLIVSIVILSLMPVSFRRPFIGVMAFSWLAYMRVQDMAWGAARTMRWSYYLGIIMIAGFVAQKRERWFFPEWRVYVMLTMVLLVIVSAVFSEDLPPETRSIQVNRVFEFIKVIGVAVFTTAVVTTREHLRLMIWIIALSLAFYGVKDGVWSIMTLFRGRIIQGPGGMIADNNDYALAMAMCVSMVFCIAQSERRPVLRRAFFIMVPLCVFTVLLTYSRGGLLSLVAGTFVMLWRSRFRWQGLIGAGVFAAVFLAVMPQSMYDRFASIGQFKEDGSAQSRFKSWAVGIRMAMDNPVWGVGLQGFRANYLEYEPEAATAEMTLDDTKVAHNSYIQMWAEVGTPSLVLYLSLFAGSFWTIWRVRRRAKRLYKDSWILHYCTMFEASLVSFMVGSTFLNRAHYDLIYHWFALIVLFEYFAHKDMDDPNSGQLAQRGRGTLRAVPLSGFDRRPQALGAPTMAEERR